MTQMIGKYTAPANIMRKKYFLITLFLLCILLSGCNSPLKFDKSQDEFGTTYRNEYIEVQIANNVANPEEIFKSIERDLNIIHAFEPIEELSVRVDNEFFKSNNKSEVECNAEFVNTPQFKQLLIANVYDLYDNWKVVGIYGNLFADEMAESLLSTNASNEKTEQRISQKVDFVSYYQNHDFSLFGAHFFPDFSSEEEIKNLSYASTSLVKYLIDNGQKEKLLKDEVSIEDIKPWAETQNIDITYLEGLYNHINEIKVGIPSAFGKLYIDTRRDINGFSIHIENISPEYDTAQKIEQCIVEFDNNIATNLELIKQKASDFYKEYERALTEVPKIPYYLNPKFPYNGCDLFEKTITLAKIEAQFHEYNHFLFNVSFRENGIPVNKPIWVKEGVEPYLDYFYYPKNNEESKSFIEENIFDEENFRRSLISNPERANQLKAYRNVLLMNFTEEELRDMDKIYNDEEKLKKYVHICTSAALGNPEFYFVKNLKQLSMNIMMNEDSTYNVMQRPSNQHYFANISFVGYLIETYGYEKMLYFSVQDFSKITFEEYFGKSYEELDADWKQYLIDNIKGGEFLVYGEKGKP